MDHIANQVISSEKQDIYTKSMSKHERLAHSLHPCVNRADNNNRNALPLAFSRKPKSPFWSTFLENDVKNLSDVKTFFQIFKDAVKSVLRRPTFQWSGPDRLPSLFRHMLLHSRLYMYGAH